MRTLGGGMYYTDLTVGERFQTIGRTIFEADLINFITCTGLQEGLFNSLEYIEKHSPTGKRLVPGALAYCICEGLLVQATLQRTGLAFLTMEFDVKGPTFVGDTVHVEVEVLESRPTSKDPNRGLVRTRNNIIKQTGETVITYTPMRLAAGRAMRDAH